MRCFGQWFLLIWCTFLSVNPVAASAQRPDPFVIDDFEGPRSPEWHERRLSERVTVYELVRVGGNGVLMATSERAASALWRRVDVDPRVTPSIRWRWKIEASVMGEAGERRREGDDYAARLFVVFDRDPFSPDTRALCYVWAGGEPVGSAYPNPYVDGVITLVLQSGDTHAGRWIVEERDVAADYERAFGERPEAIFAIAIMVDTDDTESRATAWFDDISFRRAFDQEGQLESAFPRPEH